MISRKLDVCTLTNAVRLKGRNIIISGLVEYPAERRDRMMHVLIGLRCDPLCSANYFLKSTGYNAGSDNEVTKGLCIEGELF